MRVNNMTKFTSGEWFVDGYEIQSKTCSIELAKVTIFKEGKSNAHLIASAPRLYRSLERQRVGLINLINLNLIPESHYESVRHEISLIDNELSNARGE